MKRLISALLALGFILGLTASVFAAKNDSAKTRQDWWTGSVFYQIFVRSFYDADGDGKGDLKGVTVKLDYLQSLGINAIWLNPIFEAFQYHGYDTIDYYAIEKDYGTMADFDELVKEAHKRKIRIILDMVINHTSKLHPWFLDSVTNEKSLYKDFYIWSAADENSKGWANVSGARQPAWNSYLDNKLSFRYSNFYYGAFNGTMPDLNYDNPAVVKEAKKIAKFWLDKGVDGFRMDGARFMYEDGPGKQKDTAKTFKFWKEYSSYCYSVKPDCYIIAEIYGGTADSKQYYGGEGGLTAVFNFDISAEQSGLYLGGAAKSLLPLKTAIAQLQGIVKGGVPLSFFSIFLSSHDKGRVGEFVRSEDKINLSAVLQFTLPGGGPYVYYGDEIGMRNGENKIGDAEKRNPMWWNSDTNAGFTTKSTPWCRSMAKDSKFYTNGVNVADEEKNQQSTLALYKKLISIRKSNAALQKGDYYEIKVDDTANKDLATVMSYSRADGNSLALVIFNAGKTNVTVDQAIDAPALKKNAGKLKVVDGVVSADISAGVPKDLADAILKDGKWKLDLGPKGYAIVLLEAGK